VPRSASIEAEDELVQLVLKVDPAQAVLDAQTPALEVGEQAMSSGQDNVRHRADGDRLVLDLGDVPIGRPTPARWGPIPPTSGDNDLNGCPSVRFKQVYPGALSGARANACTIASKACLGLRSASKGKGRDGI
jgi:hypothetical protein